MSIKFKVKMTVKAMYNFMIHHTYTSINGILGTVLGIVSLYLGAKDIGEGFIQTGMAFLAIGILFVFVNPILLWNKACKQVKLSPMFQKPIEYELTDTDIIIRQEGEESLLPWEAVTKVVGTSQSLIIYFSRVRAFVLPKKDIGEDYNKVVELLFTKVGSKKVKLRTMNR